MNRRAILRGSAAAVVAATLPAMGKTTKAHSDAALLDLGRRREAVLWEMDNTPGLSDAEAHRLGAEWSALDQKIMAIVPQTGAGVAVQLAVVWKITDKPARDEEAPTESASLDVKYLWQTKLNAERMAGGAA